MPAPPTHNNLSPCGQEVHSIQNYMLVPLQGAVHTEAGNCPIARERVRGESAMEWGGWRGPGVNRLGPGGEQNIQHWFTPYPIFLSLPEFQTRGISIQLCS